MSSNPLFGLWKVGTFVQLTGAAWPAGAPACVCRLNAAAVRPAALVSDESALEMCIRDDALYKLQPLPFFT